VSPSEIAFLALGLVFGGAAGAAIAQSARMRPAPRRQVRLTIAPNAIPARRSSTVAFPGGLATQGRLPGSPDAGAWPENRPAPGSDAGAAGHGGAWSASHDRTPVRSTSVPLTPVMAFATAAAPVAVLEDARGDRHARTRRAGGSLRPTLTAAAVAVMATPARTTVPIRASGTPPQQDPTESSPVSAVAEVDECAGTRRVVEERCALAGVAREHAREAADALRAAQRDYDILREQVERAQTLADPRHVAAEKERLHAAFRAASEHAPGPDETESAARTWLTEINNLNNAVRDALRVVETGTAALRGQLGGLRKLTAEADASRIAAENAESGCQGAREELAACEEAVERGRTPAAPPAGEPHPFDNVWPSEEPGLPDPGATSGPDLLSGLPAIVRILRGDREARERVVAMVSAGDDESRRDWQLRLARLVDAIVGRAVEDGFLDLPDDDPFWRLFEHGERRAIVAALSALGFRFDGMGGFSDDRVPAARDLSLAVGYAGLDPMRIRTWPRETELAQLLGQATVAADEWLAGEAPDLALARMVESLGNRAAELADLWNAWGRVRPALLSA
jgi:hypothetical protein